jgi:hypothetical protein
MASTSNRMSGSTTVWDVGVMCASWTANPDRSCQARLRLRFERSDRGAAGQLLRLGAGIELDPLAAHTRVISIIAGIAP